MTPCLLAADAIVRGWGHLFFLSSCRTDAFAWISYRYTSYELGVGHVNHVGAAKVTNCKPYDDTMTPSASTSTHQTRTPRRRTLFSKIVVVSFGILMFCNVLWIGAGELSMSRLHQAAKMRDLCERFISGY